MSNLQCNVSNLFVLCMMDYRGVYEVPIVSQAYGINSLVACQKLDYEYLSDCHTTTCQIDTRAIEELA